MIYEPAEDSFLLEKVVRKYSKGKKVLDVGTGSGIQAEAALSFGAKKVLAIDIDEEAFEFCRRKKINCLKSDLFSKVNGKFGLIIFNPPYLPRDEREDSESARITSGGKKGDEIILRFLRSAGKFLEKNGKILLLLSSLTPRARILKIMKEKKFTKKIVAEEKVFMEKLEVWEIKF